MGIVERIKGLIGGDRAAGEAPESKPTRAEEELAIETVERDEERDRNTAYDRLTDVDDSPD